MKKLGTGILAASALLLAGTASAATSGLPQWTYGQVGYFQADSTGKDQTDAYTVEGSLQFLDVMHFQASYINGSLGAGPVTNDFDGYQLTLGYHPAITESSQAVFNVIYYDSNYKVDEGSDPERDGYGLGIGFRSNVTDHVEASAIAYWTNSNIKNGNFDFCSGSNCDSTNVSLQFGGRWNFTKAISAGATVILGDDVIGSGADSMNVDVRWTFDGVDIGSRW